MAGPASSRAEITKRTYMLAIPACKYVFTNMKDKEEWEERK
jgi:hypothetical protein